MESLGPNFIYNYTLFTQLGRNNCSKQSAGHTRSWFGFRHRLIDKVQMGKHFKGVKQSSLSGFGFSLKTSYTYKPTQIFTKSS